MAELETIAVGLAMAINLGSAKIVVESDCKGTIGFILSSDRYFNEFGSILEDIVLFL